MKGLFGSFLKLKEMRLEMRDVEIYNITVSTLDFTFKEADTEDGRLRRILNFSHTLD